MASPVGADDPVPPAPAVPYGPVQDTAAPDPRAYAAQYFRDRQERARRFPGSVPPPVDAGATTAMVLGVASVVLTFVCGLGALAAPFALVMGRRSMRRIDASAGRLGGRRRALVGFVTGLVGTAMLMLAVLVVGFFVLLALTGHVDDSSGRP